MRELGYLPDDPIGRAGVEATYEEQLRGMYGLQLVETDPSGRRIQVISTERQPLAGSSLRLTIDTKVQEEAEKALHWGMKAANLKRAVIIVMNPQNGEILAMVSEPTYDNNLFSGGIDQGAYKKLLNDPQKPLVNHAISDQYPPGSTYKLVAGTGVLADGKITPADPDPDGGVPDPRRRSASATGTAPGSACATSTAASATRATRSSTRPPRCSGSIGSATGRSSTASAGRRGIDLPSEVGGIVPTNQWKIDEFGLPIYPGEVYLAGIGQGYDAVTPLQLLNAYATLANGGTRYRPARRQGDHRPRRDGHRGRARGHARARRARTRRLRVMRHAARNVPVIHHTYNLVDLPIIVAGKTGTAEFGTPGPDGDYPFHNWFVSFVPKNPYKKPGDPYGFKAIEKGDSELAVVVFSYNAGTLGNTSTEISKYFYQLHFGIKKDYRLPYLMDRGPYYRAPE